ncbi:MAG TPA: bifunctional aldolase/short-chain dehydrogenase [Polyangiaceae bacterium]|nr:bifunctional aldolase/short-chain dehydrogenase [Polyangiaceae bacterium]
MESRYNPADAERFVRSLAGRASDAVALRTYTARLIGGDPALVLHGGGNTSVKATATTLLGERVDVIHVKGSGWDLATIEPEGHPAVRLEPLRRLRSLEMLGDEAMVNELRVNLLEATAPTPSVETLLHAFLPARFVDHTHADAVLVLADQPDAEKIFAGIFGPGLVWVPYVMPGFALAQRSARAFEAVARRSVVPCVMVLEKHGVFTWGDTARESYDRMIDAVTRAELHVESRRRPRVVPAGAQVADRDVLPALRGALATLAGQPAERGPIVRTRVVPEIFALAGRPDAGDLVSRGCVTPDHVLRTKPTALFVNDPPYANGRALRARFEGAVATYAREYDAYFENMCRAKGVSRRKLDPWPRVVLLPGYGACAIGASAREADVALDVYEHTARVMLDATDVGTYAPCSRSDLFDVEYWTLEQAKLKPAAQQPLSACIAVVTGAGGGIGFATASRMLAAGAHVLLVDRDADELGRATQGLGTGARDHAATVVADVRDPVEVRRAFDAAIAAWGGVDVVVSNAGTAPEGRLETVEGERALRDSLEVNLLSHVLVARAAVEVLSAQGRGGCLLFNASKSAFNAGPGFGPYAVAKSALVALMRQYAVDLGGRGIRSNAVNADRIRTGLFGGGVLESRAKARGLAVDDYFRANLLAREVLADDVADAFVYLATARSTTGCVVTVDGGNAAAFPR